MKKLILDFLSALEGYHQVLKEIHWSTGVKSEHLLTDDIDGEVLKYEDRIAENAMGILSTRFGIGDLKTLLPSSKTLSSVLKEMGDDVTKLKDSVGKQKNTDGLINILDDFSESINSWKYLETFK